jgi:hypothetical protein
MIGQGCKRRFSQYKDSDAPRGHVSGDRNIDAHHLENLKLNSVKISGLQAETQTLDPVGIKQT